jgi:DNA-binding CsgD family transcriptional regulator
MASNAAPAVVTSQGERTRGAMEIDDVLWSRIDGFAQEVIGSDERAWVARAVFRTDEGNPVLVLIGDASSRPKPPVALLRRRFRLTRREAEVALLLADRLSNQELGRRLGVTVHTARRHTEQVLLKLGLSSRMHVRRVLARVMDELSGGDLAVEPPLLRVG